MTWTIIWYTIILNVNNKNETWKTFDSLSSPVFISTSSNSGWASFAWWAAADSSKVLPGESSKYWENYIIHVLSKDCTPSLISRKH